MIPFDQNGHMMHSWPAPDRIQVDINHVRTLLDEIPGYPVRSALELDHRCTWCGQRPPVILDGDTARVTTPCPAVDGVNMCHDLHVPSGRLIVDDDLRSVYRVDDSQLGDYNTAIGQAAYVAAMFEIGCAFGPVGNSCPSLARTGEGRYIIASTGGGEFLPVGAEVLATVCTDLWAYSIADHADWESKGGKVTNWSQTVVDVPAGVYRFTHHTGERSFDPDAAGLVVFADIEYLGPTR